MENRFEKDLSPQSIISSDGIVEVEKQRLRLAEKFLSDDITQKTEIDTDERVLLPLIQILADDPYTISRRVATSKDNPYHCSREPQKSQNRHLQSFLSLYFKLGVPVGRKGRKEEVSVLQAALQPNPQLTEQPNQKSGLKWYEK